MMKKGTRRRSGTGKRKREEGQAASVVPGKEAAAEGPQQPAPQPAPAAVVEVDEEPGVAEVVEVEVEEEQVVEGGEDTKLGPAGRTWGEVGVGAWLGRACRELGLVAPTLVQARCIPPILAGRDVIGSAKTGSGKTAAFALPILQRLSEEPHGIFALVLTPTRELAMQIAEQFRALGAAISARVTLVVGGMERTKQSQLLSKRPHIVVATPGRLVDLLLQDDHRGLVAGLRFLVLDEADRLLDPAFAPALGQLLPVLPAKRQTLLFSATMTSSLRKLEHVIGQNAFRFEATVKYQPLDTLNQRYMFMPARIKDCYLVYLLRTFLAEPAPAPPALPEQIIVFASTCNAAQLLAETLRLLDVPSAPLHSRIAQNQRNQSLRRFKSRIVRVLVATDVASRGLDIPTVGVVINYDVPGAAKDYIHRVGRTARAGRPGTAITLVTQNDVERLLTIEGRMGMKLSEYEAKEEDVLAHLNEATTAKKIAALNLDENGFFKAPTANLDKRPRKRHQRDNNNDSTPAADRPPAPSE